MSHWRQKGAYLKLVLDRHTCLLQQPMQQVMQQRPLNTLLCMLAACPAVEAA